jgi:hypothetical protein
MDWEGYEKDDSGPGIMLIGPESDFESEYSPGNKMIISPAKRYAIFLVMSNGQHFSWQIKNERKAKEQYEDIKKRLFVDDSLIPLEYSKFIEVPSCELRIAQGLSEY